MATFNLTIDGTGNAAFDGEVRTELSRMLEYVAHRFRDGVAFEAPILDYNGNTVGRWTYLPGPEPDALDGCEAFDEAVEAIGVYGTVRPAPESVHRSVSGSALSRDPNGRTWTWTLSAPDRPDLSGTYWTGSGITGKPDVFEVIVSVLLDATYLSETFPWTGEAELSDVDVETIRERERWFRSMVDADGFDRLAELAHRWEEDS